MIEKHFHIAGLIRKSMISDLDANEKVELQQWVDENDENRKFYEEVTSFEYVTGSLKAVYRYDLDKMRAALNISAAPKIYHRVHFLRTAWFRVAVAVLIIITGFLAYHQFYKGKPIAASPASADINPGTVKAVLTLADGSIINLDSAGNGQLAQQPGTVINKLSNGELIYSPYKKEGGSKDGAVSYNTMSTPRGGTYQLILPDDSKVWLNAESSITFPTTFTGNFREVKMTGEIYFEISKNAATPFIVKTPKNKIEVLGTAFNVNVYPGEIPKTSLVDGTVKIDNRRLAPGQAYVSGEIIATDLEVDIAWKMGDFNFKNAEITQVVRQLARWYDLEIRYEGNIAKGNITGEMSRSWKLSQVMSTIKKLGYNTRLEGKTLVVFQ